MITLAAPFTMPEGYSTFTLNSLPLMSNRCIMIKIAISNFKLVEYSWGVELEDKDADELLDLSKF